MGHEIEDDEVAIIIKPDIGEDGEWNGELRTGLVFGQSNHPLATRAAMDLALTMASCVNVLEQYPELFDYFEDSRHQLLKEMFPKAYAESELEVDKEMDYTTDGNVIKLTKWTKTLGEA
tara:strand:- start:125 stop:481 length:357 start_codon:yes stop_codon:yes gene_type:complete